MRIFVQTAGKAREFEYSWFSLNSDGNATKLRKTPEQLEIALKVVHSDEISCALMLNLGLLGFVCTKLNSICQKRSDFNGRKIRNSLGVFAESYSENQLIYSLFANFLQDKNSWEAKVDVCIQEKADSQNQISIECNNLIQVINNIPRLPFSLCKDFQPVLWPYSEFDPGNFLNQIQQNGLPEVDGVIFLEREYEDEKFFSQNKVVFGVSKLIKTKIYAERLNSTFWEKYGWVAITTLIIATISLLIPFQSAINQSQATPQLEQPFTPVSSVKDIPSSTVNLTVGVVGYPASGPEKIANGFASGSNVFPQMPVASESASNGSSTSLHQNEIKYGPFLE